MTILASVLSVLLIIMWLSDAMRLRKRLTSIPVLQSTENPGDPDHLFVATAPVPEGIQNAASAHANRQNAKVLDLIPGKLAVDDLMGLLYVLDPATFRKQWLERGHSAGRAFVMTKDVAERSRYVGKQPTSRPALLALVDEAKRCAPDAMEHALVPGLAPTPSSARQEAEILRSIFSANIAPMVLSLQFFVLLMLAFCLVFSPWFGLAALVVFQLQPALVVVGSKASPRDLLPQVLLRLPLMLLRLAGLAVHMAFDKYPSYSKLRESYKERIAAGPESLLEPRRTTCPLCESAQLKVQLKTTDLLQGKPGVFELNRCVDCGHIFQNPRLSIAGLGYYYDDFYEGLGEDEVGAVFAFAESSYGERARVLKGRSLPERWLDVGGGHGHFCLAAREVWPDTIFEALDLSEAIEEAERRGWADKGHRGLFPDKAAELADRYDVVSMSHYMEHTTDPRAEMAAAHTVLKDGGHILIEVPDPESRFKSLLGRWWTPYFQPQHLNILPAKRMCDLLEERGFEISEVQRAESHIAVDFLMSWWFRLTNMAPVPDRPWRKPSTALGYAWHFVVWSAVGPPILLAAFAVDNLAATTFAKSEGWSNAYRVLAQKPHNAG